MQRILFHCLIRYKHLNNTETDKYWLALLRCEGIGSKTFLKCLEHCGEPEQVFKADSSTLASLGLREKSIHSIKNADWSRVESDLNWLAQADNHLIKISDDDYPQVLKEIADPPPLLFARGDVDLVHFPQIAIVGSRNPSSSGLQIATDFAYSLSQSGFTITSGLALGIDAASHRGALNAGAKTIAVTGTGLDRVYPAAHKQLATDIINNGVLISEFPPGTSAKANHFPRRNRIISGLCMGLLVVEAAQKSGSLISARMALEQNREVFAIPGSIYNPLARGCNGLIRQGAKLVETTDDILQELKYNFEFSQPTVSASTPQITSTFNDINAEQQQILAAIQFSPTSVDSVVTATNISVENISANLLMLELQGYISAAPGGGYARLK